MLDVLRFYTEVPVLAYKKYASPISNLVFLSIFIYVVAGFIFIVAINDSTTIEGLFEKIQSVHLNDKIITIITLVLLGIILALLIYGEYKKVPILNFSKLFKEGKIEYTTTKKGYDKPNMNPYYDVATPADIMNSLREDDMNTLMFGRSKFPTDAMTENSKGGEILRGYENSSEMGEQYGTFTGMTLYGGPEMFDQRDIHRVWKDLENIDGPQKRKMSPELVLLRNQYNDINERINNTTNESAKKGLMIEQKNIKKKIFQQVLEDRNDATGIPSEEKLSVEDFKNVVG